MLAHQNQLFVGATHAYCCGLTCVGDLYKVRLTRVPALRCDLLLEKQQQTRQVARQMPGAREDRIGTIKLYLVKFPLFQLGASNPQSPFLFAFDVVACFP